MFKAIAPDSTSRFWLAGIDLTRDASNLLSWTIPEIYASGHTHLYLAGDLVVSLCMSLATIKRCLRQLVEFGWLLRTEGRGAGNNTEYDFRAPCNITPFRPKKKGAPATLSTPQKSTPVTEKRLTGELSYIKDQQSKEQNPAAEPDLPD